MVTPIARLTSEYEVIVVPASSPYKTMGDLVAAFKADPGKVSWHGGSAGGTDHILAGLIAQAVGVDPAKVNYVAAKGGGDQVANIVGGHVTAGIAGHRRVRRARQGRPHARARGFARRRRSTASRRSRSRASTSCSATGAASSARPGITPAQRDALVAAVKTATESAAWKESLTKYGWEPVFLGGDAFKTFLDEDTKRIAGILDSLGLRK